MRSKCRLFMLLLAAAMLFLICAPALAATGEVYALYTTTIRKTPAAAGTSLGTLSAGRVAEKLGVNGNWTLIRYAGVTGYVLSADVKNYISINHDGTLGSGLASSAGGGDVSVSPMTTYVATANANVRSGPGTRYRVVGTLKQGETVEGAERTVGNWTNIIYNGKSSYVSSSYVSPGSLSAPVYTQAPLPRLINVVYARVKTTATERAGAGKAAGELLAGARAVEKGVSGKYTLIETQGKSGYVPTEDIVSVTGTGSYEMAVMNKWMYGGNNGAYALLMPVEDTAYRVGRIAKNEAVWALSGNSYWTQVYVQGRVAYVTTPSLSQKPLSGSEKGASGRYAPGTSLTVKAAGGAMTYSTTRFDEYIPIYESGPYGTIRKGTKVAVMYCTGDLACVFWDDDRTAIPPSTVDFPTNLHAAYVRLSNF